jgi:hypothetical protein
MTGRARRLKFPLADVEVLSLSRTCNPGGKAGYHQPLQATGDHIMPPPTVSDRSYERAGAWLSLTQVNAAAALGQSRRLAIGRLLPVLASSFLILAV